MKPTPPKSLMWEPTQATLDIGLGVLCGGKGTAPGCAHCVGAPRYQALSKAFERVNPHWILRILHIKGAPTWVIKYTRHVLFHRRVRHKVQGRLLPSRTILQGVDMGRSFSVFLFCLAMDSPGGGCGPPRGMSITGRGGPARVRGDVKLRYSAGVTLKTPVPNEP